MPSLINKGKSAKASASAEPSSSSSAPPPTYEASGKDKPVSDAPIQPSKEELDSVNLTAAFDNLNLTDAPGAASVDSCLAHLKLLFAFQSMKEDVGYTDGLWDLWDNRADNPDPLIVSELATARAGVPDGPKQEHDKKLEVLSKLREKRWALFVARAVDRYEAWWSSMTANPLTEADMEIPDSPKYLGFVQKSTTSGFWDEKMLPPLGKD
jgi:hypothetical protein